MDLRALTQKMEKLDQYRPFPAALVRNLEQWLRVELTYTSNAIEGNTLTRQETALVLEKGITVGGKSLVEHLEAANHGKALDWVGTQIDKKPNALSEKDILHLHAIILHGVDDANAGNYRDVPVRISGAAVVLPNHVKVPTLMKDFVDWLQTYCSLHPVEFAALAQYKLVSIHPFVDGNGRTARLLMNLLLLMQGYPPAILAKKHRLQYLNALEKAQTGGLIDDYMKLMFQSVNRSMDIYLKALINDDPNTKGHENKAEFIRIGALGKQTQKSVSTIRHWTKEGLLEVDHLTDAGYQMYHPSMVQRAKRIAELQQKRFTLKEIKDLL